LPNSAAVVHARGFRRVVTAYVSAAALGVFVVGLIAMDQTQAQQVENNGQDFTRPEDLVQERFVYQSAPGNGVVPGTTRQVTTESVILRSDLKFDLPAQWTVALRGDLPFVTKDSVATDNPAGDYVNGIGDADFQAALVKTLDNRWAAGAGFRIIAPTGFGDLTSGRWQALPIIGARYMLPELGDGSFFTALVRYDVSFAGDPSAKNISNLQFAPTLNVALPDRWFVTFYPSPDIRINYGDPIVGQTGRLFLPMDVLVGRTMTKNLTMSLEVGVPMIKDYPVYDFKTVARLDLRF
jgi:hypothetical protein